MCLQKSASDRYQSASELADDLDRYLQDLPLEAAPPTLPIRMWYWLRDVPVIAALNGRQVRSATLAQRLFQFVVPVVLILGFFLLRQSGCFAPQPPRSPAEDQGVQDSSLNEQP